jgi:23S rRNA (pseudouridine1915-N3)-methyltransferase
MKISFWSVGKPHDKMMKEGILEFTQRAGNYFPIEWVILPVPKNAASMPEAGQKKKEGEMILSQLKPEDYLVALDEYGKEWSSEGLSSFLEQRAMDGTRTIVFLIGGAFGLDESVLKAARMKWSLSKLTFPHQLVRLILAEQVYRACTIMKGEKYHHK